MWSRQPSLEFLCPGCGATIREIIDEVPSYDAMADRESDAQGYAEQAVTCSECERRFDVSIANTGACLVAELAGEKTHVSVIDDPVHTPDDEWEAEAY